MPRYERRDGEKVDVWLVEQRASVVHTRTGRLGSRGSARTRTYDTPDTAMVRLQGLVTDQQRKGYELVDEAAVVEDGLGSLFEERPKAKVPSGAEVLQQEVVADALVASLEASEVDLDAPTFSGVLDAFRRFGRREIECRGSGWWFECFTEVWGSITEWLDDVQRPPDTEPDHEGLVVCLARQFEPIQGDLRRVSCWIVVDLVDATSFAEREESFDMDGGDVTAFIAEVADTGVWPVVEHAPLAAVRVTDDELD